MGGEACKRFYNDKCSEKQARRDVCRLQKIRSLADTEEIDSDSTPDGVCERCNLSKMKKQYRSRMPMDAICFCSRDGSSLEKREILR